MTDGFWPIGCQARPWLQAMGRDAFAARLPEVMAQIAAIGFAGFETALDRLPLDRPDDFARAREAAGGIRLAAAHVGGRWWEPEAAERVASLTSAVAKLPGLGCDTLMVSVAAGVEAVPDDGLAALAAPLAALGRAAREHGVRVALHNHAHELADEGRVLRAILGGAPPQDLALGVDLGWVAYAGEDPAAFVERHGDRIAYVHVRDVRGRGAARGFVEVGRGELDWPAILVALRAKGFTGWLVAESEFGDRWLGERDPAATARAEYAGIVAAIAGAGGVGSRRAP